MELRPKSKSRFIETSTDLHVNGKSDWLLRPKYLPVDGKSPWVHLIYPSNATLAGLKDPRIYLFMASPVGLID